ncbi:aconitate hydratase [Psychromarinibacter sp. C21-152]|uniref:Aconitate hydratase n=1 Tax=Psychromarinibacter sediminicola TaxID=3033385 RepID=A0AAE3NVR5_9RHOB|nr:aconitate hydratase [Psychromarinibacter sediminicola]MDF0603027.1 aconitate hydratase [Psychromarinibacter sediminicola]
MPNVTQKLIAAHLAEPEDLPAPGEQIALTIDQTLTQDATGTLVMLALEAFDPERVATEVSVQYVDHNLLQADERNAGDHRFLRTACQRYGLWFSPPGNGVSHPLHMTHFGRPGATLLGSDSHTPASGALGMLAMGAGGIDVALAMLGEPVRLKMPEVWGVRLTGALPDWVSAKDVVLEMLRRHGVRGGLGRVIEYHGPGLDGLTAMDRHVIANMGTELGATTTVFPSDETVREFLAARGRGDDWAEIGADADATYDVEEEIDLSTLEPLIATPSSPGNVVPVREVAGEPIAQSYVGSSANPGFRDFAVVAEILRDRTVAPGVSLDINPTSRDDLRDLSAGGQLAALLGAGARLHQAGCNGCIGMGQAPAVGRNSLRTVPRNFPDRSGTPDDSVFLCSPETAAASALTGRITDPRDLDRDCPAIAPRPTPTAQRDQFHAPPDAQDAREIEIAKAPHIAAIPKFDELPDRLEPAVLLALGDDISTDEILPAGAEILPYRSNIPEISRFAFRVVDDSYPARAEEVRDDGGHVIVAGENYGQGSSREHAAIAPRYLGLRAVLARSFARIHRQNLVNFGVLPLTYDSDAAPPEQGDTLRLTGLHDALAARTPVTAETGSGHRLTLQPALGAREAEIVRAGGVVNWYRQAA